MFSCRFTTNTASLLQVAYDTAKLNNDLHLQPDCSHKLVPISNEPNGIVRMDLVLYPQEIGYVVTVTVELAMVTHNSTFTQLLQVKSGQSPDVGI